MSAQKPIAMVPFPRVKDAMRAEVMLKKLGFKIKLTAPPPELRTGCDLAIVIDVERYIEIEKLLVENKIEYHDLVYGDKLIPLLELTKVFDLGEYTMVRHGSMKITFEKSTGTIVNISGGGCPDIPYITISLVGKKIEEAPHPQTVGSTICAYSLGKAYDKALEIWRMH